MALKNTIQRKPQNRDGWKFLKDDYVQGWTQNR